MVSVQSSAWLCAGFCMRIVRDLAQDGEVVAVRDGGGFMSGFYNAKNYTEQGGEVTHIGGVLEFGEEASVAGFPGAVNMGMVSGNTVKDVRDGLNALIVALKNAGIMVPDEWALTVLACPETGAMPAVETAENSGHATVLVEDEVIHIALDRKVEELLDADHGETWGVHKWLGFGVRTGLAAVAGIRFTDDTGAEVIFAEADAQEAETLGLSAGDFVLYIKAEDPKFLTGEKGFSLWADGCKEQWLALKVTEPDESADEDPENGGDTDPQNGDGSDPLNDGGSSSDGGDTVPDNGGTAAPDDGGDPEGSNG